MTTVPDEDMTAASRDAVANATNAMSTIGPRGVRNLSAAAETET
jgi:hypothetical protein